MLPYKNKKFQSFVDSRVHRGKKFRSFRAWNNFQQKSFFSETCYWAIDFKVSKRKFQKLSRVLKTCYFAGNFKVSKHPPSKEGEKYIKTFPSLEKNGGGL